MLVVLREHVSNLLNLRGLSPGCCATNTLSITCLRHVTDVPALVPDTGSDMAPDSSVCRLHAAPHQLGAVQVIMAFETAWRSGTNDYSMAACPSVETLMCYNINEGA